MRKKLLSSTILIIFVLLNFSQVFSNQKKDFSKAEEYFRLGEKLREQFKLEQAKAHFKKAIVEDMNFTQAHRGYIDIVLQKGEELRGDLQKEYEAYLGIQPNNPVIYYALGRIYEDIKDKEKVFKKAIELDPDYPWGHFGMAYVYITKKETEKAITCYEKAIELEPNEALFYTSLARLLYNRHPDRYKQVEENILKKFPDSYSTALIVYQRAEGIKDKAEKAAVFETYLNTYPNGPNVFIAIRSVLDFYKKDNPEKAVKIAREVLSRPMVGEDKRAHRMAYLFLFQMAFDSKNKNEMENTTCEILASKNTDPSLYFQIASQLQKEKHFELAEKFYLKAINMIKPENVYGTMAHGSFTEESLADYCKQVTNWYCSCLGKLYLEMNLPNKALDQFKQVDFEDPEAEHYLNLAIAYNQMGDKEKAYDSLIESLSLAPNDEAQEMLNQLSDQLHKTETKEKIWEKRLEQAKPAVDFTLPDLDGNLISLKDFTGKVVLVNFWFPACGPCQVEFPHIQKIHDKYKEQGVAVLLIQIAQTQEEGKKFLKENKYTMTSLYSDRKWAEENYGVKAAPANFFIDRQGRVIFKSTGYSPGHERVIESQIIELLEFEKKE